MNIVQCIGVGCADAVEIALAEELNQCGKEKLSAHEIHSVRMQVSKIVRQTVRARFIPKTHMDM